MFRLGTLYEKGMGVKKDVDIARRYYVQAAERGNAKAMHNLAVLDADGGGKGANYKSAAQWFRKAADRGVADSQFNLGILYARGIGVEQNLAESFKWFSLAAAQGDADAGRKRDDIAKRLDAQSLAAAKLAIQTFTPEPQPDDAVNVAAPGRRLGSAPAPATQPSPPPSRLRQARRRRALIVIAAMPLRRAACTSSINSYRLSAPARPDGRLREEDRLSVDDQPGQSRTASARSPTGPWVARAAHAAADQTSAPPTAAAQRLGASGISGRSPSSSC